MAQAHEEFSSDEYDDAHDVLWADVKDFAEQNHRVYLELQARVYEEKQKTKKKQLKEEALRRRISSEKSEAYFRGWGDAYMFYKKELPTMSDQDREDAIKEQELRMRKQLMKRKRQEQPDNRDGRGKGRGSASSAGTGPTSVPHRPENPSSNAQGGGSASAAGTGPTSVPHRPENLSSNTQVGGSASSASSGL